MKAILKFIRELAVVVTGIAITVGIGFWINNKSAEKELEQYMTAIKLELEINAKNFDRYATWMQKSVNYANYLETNDKKSLSKDSLLFYCFSSSFYYDGDDDEAGCGYMNINSFSEIFITNAFEMFKSCSSMSKIKDKMVLQAIWTTYSEIEGTKASIERAFRIKEAEMMKEQQLLAEGKPVAVPMQMFYGIDFSESLVRHCKNRSWSIHRLLLILELGYSQGIKQIESELKSAENN
jgi:hypothetical protein